MKRNVWVAWLSPLALAWPMLVQADGGQASGSAVVSSSSSSATAGGSSRAQSSVRGHNASVTVNGHHLEVNAGRLELDGVGHGDVTPEQTVTLRVEDGAVAVLVDDVERDPEE